MGKFFLSLLASEVLISPILDPVYRSIDIELVTETLEDVFSRGFCCASDLAGLVLELDVVLLFTFVLHLDCLQDGLVEARLLHEAELFYHVLHSCFLVCLALLDNANDII